MRPGHVAIIALWASAGCSNPKDDFIGSRVLQTCNQSWPACGAVAGCLLGDADYMAGQFPGDNQAVIQLQKPSTVALNLYISSVESSGTFAQESWFEGACRSRSDVKVTGVAFVQEAQREGIFTRTYNLLDSGDHLVQFSSDAQAQYLFSVTVTPLVTAP